MGSEFQIRVQRLNEDMYVQPVGDFDGEAARRLITLLHREDQGRGRVFIDTSCLGCMHARGCALFKEGLNRFLLTEQRLVFIGYKGRTMAHAGEQVSQDAAMTGLNSGPEAGMGCKKRDQEQAA